MPLLTEEECKKLICPILTQSATVHGGIRHCEGSKCAMWRWKTDYKTARLAPDEKPGYCGLAGDPTL